MNVLLLAPHPFYQERGTPIAVDLLLKAFARRGTRVDVLAYHEGSDRSYGPGVTIHRIPPVVGARNVKPGFSVKKLLCDRVFWQQASRMLRAGSYDVVHAIEESVFMAMGFRRRFGIPYLYDMDSSMPRQIADGHPLFRPLLPVMNRFESSAARNALAVVPVCDALADIARHAGARQVFLLRDISLLDPASSAQPAGLRAVAGGTGPLFLYLGNLEAYQGIDLLVQASAAAVARIPEARVVVAGGAETDVLRYRAMAARLGLTDFVRFIGPRPVAQMAALFREADVLLSPRIKGGNTPMKIYSYLDSGKPTLATRLSTHTQVLDDTVSVLAEPDPASFAAGMVQLATDPALRQRLGANAHRLAQERYSQAAYTQAFTALYDWVESTIRATA